MRRLALALAYTAVTLGANPGWAEAPQIADLRAGDMKKLVLHEEAKPASTVAFTLEEGGEGSLADYAGKYVLVNFWATWCAPCRKEMPQLDALQEEFGGEDFEVVTIAVGRNSPEGIEKFFTEAGVDSLPGHMDPKQKLAAEMAVAGLPITVILDPEGNEIARLMGDADWSSESAKSIVRTLVESARTES